MTGEPRYCAFCGSPLRRVHGNRCAYACPGCAHRTYRHPAVGVAVVVVEDGRVLLGRRARGPHAGLWCVPCGYVEWDEDIRDSARREMLEETGLDVVLGPVCAVHSNFHDRERQTVGVWFRGSVRSGSLRAGDDLDAVDFFRIDDVPPLAFPTDERVVEQLRREAAAARGDLPAHLRSDRRRS